MSDRRTNYDVARQAIRLLDLGSYGEQCVEPFAGLLGEWLDELRRELDIARSQLETAQAELKSQTIGWEKLFIAAHEQLTDAQRDAREAKAQLETAVGALKELAGYLQCDPVDSYGSELCIKALATIQQPQGSR